ncbi:MAG: carboxypeptidase regulatory-like domain-containing protein, partial [Terriglobales bacterium]
MSSHVASLVFRVAGILALALLGLSLSAAQEQAQTETSTGAITGKVSDQAGVALPNARVVLRFMTANLVIPVNDKGFYSISGLYPGVYTLTVSAPNFSDTVFDNISLTPGKKLTLDAPLEPAALKRAVESGPEPTGQNASPPEQKIAGDKSAITGMVTDQTGAVVTEAKAVLTSTAGAKFETPVSDKGAYSFTGLEPGTYKLVVTAPNFADMPFENITLTAGLELTLDAPLTPAKAKTEEVNVESGNLEQVETESATVSGTITQKEVVSIGLNGRNFTQLIALAPGVSNQTGQDEAKVGVVGSVKYSVNGGRVEYNTFEVDGSDVLNTGLNGAAATLMVYPSLDAIQEVKVLTSNYGAQYGRTASGTVQVTTKSGASKWHGNLYDFVRNEAFNARNFFDVVYSSPPPPGQLVGGQTFGTKAPLYRRQDFGGTIGGPLY